MYVDVVQDTSLGTTPSRSNDKNLTIGRSLNAVSPGYTVGTIDDVRIYNRALSAAEISRLYELGR